ncbi:MAG: hypothetical protein QOC63_4731 [Mycobacterium sp.]|nr:hypothetical protein [Mycobacterium sp.]
MGGPFDDCRVAPRRASGECALDEQGNGVGYQVIVNAFGADKIGDQVAPRVGM